MSRIATLLETRRWVYWLDKSKPGLEGSPNTHPVSIVIENESGHFPTGAGENELPWYWDEATCKLANEERGFTELQVLDVVSSSMAAGRVLRD